MMDELTFVVCNRAMRTHVGRDGEGVVLRIGRRRLTFPVQAVPALIKMIVEATLRRDGSMAQEL